MNMKLKKLLNDIQKTEDKIAELQEHLKRQNTLRQQIAYTEVKLNIRMLLLQESGAHVKDLAWRAVWEHADGRQDLVK